MAYSSDSPSIYLLITGIFPQRLPCVPLSLLAFLGNTQIAAATLDPNMGLALDQQCLDLLLGLM